jgi:single-strand DNA-binding protein
VWDREAEYVSQHLHKGRPVLVEGRHQLNEWEDRTTNQRRSRFEIVARRVSVLDKTTTEAEPFDVEECRQMNQ